MGIATIDESQQKAARVAGFDTPMGIFEIATSFWFCLRD
jgi:hypothetical protein